MTGLARCAGDVREFLDRYWGRAPLHRAGADATGFADLFSLAEVDRLVTSTAARTPAFRLVRDGRPLEPGRYTRTARIGGQSVSGVADPAAIFQEFRNGATIVFQGLHRSCPPLTRFCRDLELELSHAVQANAYVTPAGSRGLGVHYDTHDVFVLQLAGAKLWSIHEPVLADPLPSQPWKGTADDAGEPCLSVDLQAGDFLYVPRGFLHSAEAQRDLSAHLTIGVVTTTWYDVVRDVVGGIAGEAEFRRALPVGFASGTEGLAAEVEDTLARLRKWLDEVDARAVADDMAGRFWSGRPQLLAGQLQQLLAVGGIDDRSLLRRREGSVCHLMDVDDRLTVVLGTRRLQMPADLRPAMDRIAGGGPFRLEALADLMDEASRRVLARRLVIEGLLEMVPDG
ncbi:MAG: cupin domain-containing protein [Actinomycetota bacterium]|nr:cupin domain-containing protein [Actinomycetota bacterium]